MSVSYPNQYRNYCIIELPKRRSLEEIKTSLENPKSEDTVIEDLYELNLMLDGATHVDSGSADNDETINRSYNSKSTSACASQVVAKVAEIYPTLSKYNQTDSPNIQSFLAGIYRKTKVPDAFGPLIAMLVRNSINPPKNTQFDVNEEIGGAILDYLA